MTAPKPEQGKQPQPAQQQPGSGPSSRTGQPAPQPTPAPQSQSSGDDGDPTPGGAVRAEVEESYKARTTVPGRPGVDARLDNRVGAFAPPLEEWPAKPQQIDGPDVPGQAEHTRRTFEQLEDTGDHKGMFSPGPHGLSDESARVSDEPNKA